MQLSDLLGCGLVIVRVTQHLIGLMPFVRLVRAWSPAPARLEHWPDSELDRPRCAPVACLITVLPFSPRTGTDHVSGEWSNAWKVCPRLSMS